MNILDYLTPENEKPLDRLVTDGGFVGIFRTIGCIGDSLSSGEFESTADSGATSFHDFFDYSWGQYIARAAGCKVYNFSRGGMTAKEYMESFAEANGFWGEDKLCQAYILALGVNDVMNSGQEIGTVSDIDLKDYKNNKPTFVGYYSAIVQRLKTMQPKAKFFFVTMLYNEKPEQNAQIDKHAEALYQLAEFLGNAYVLDIRKYMPVQDAEYKKNFYLGGHLNACGYLFTARCISSYIDYIIRHNMDDFRQVSFIGTPFERKLD